MTMVLVKIVNCYFLIIKLQRHSTYWGKSMASIKRENYPSNQAGFFFHKARLNSRKTTVQKLDAKSFFYLTKLMVAALLLSG